MQACGSETTILDNNDGHDLVMLGPGPSVCTSWIFRGMSTLLPSKLRQRAVRKPVQGPPCWSTAEGTQA